MPFSPKERLGPGTLLGLDAELVAVCLPEVPLHGAVLLAALDVCARCAMPATRMLPHKPGVHGRRPAHDAIHSTPLDAETMLPSQAITQLLSAGAAAWAEQHAQPGLHLHASAW